MCVGRGYFIQQNAYQPDDDEAAVVNPAFLVVSWTGDLTVFFLTAFVCAWKFYFSSYVRLLSRLDPLGCTVNIVTYRLGNQDPPREGYSQSQYLSLCMVVLGLFAGVPEDYVALLLAC